MSRSRHERPAGVLPAAGLVLVGLLASAVGSESAAAQPREQILVLDFDGRGTGASLLAAQLPASQRKNARRAFDRALIAYRQVERNLGLRKNDPAVAVAALVSSCVAAHHGVDVSDAALAAVVVQVRRAMSAYPRLFRAVHPDRAAVAEQMAIIGMSMMPTRMGKDDAPPSGGRRSTWRLCEAYFKTRVQHLEITEAGLGWRRGQPSGLLAALVAPPVDTEAIRDAIAASSERIEMVGLRHRPDDWDGTGSFDFQPTLLLKSGDAVCDLGAISDRRGLDGHRKTNPEQWTRWRRDGKNVHTDERCRPNSSAPLEEMQRPLPVNTRLSGSFSREIDGSSFELSAFAWRTLTFDGSGRFSGSDASGSRRTRRPYHAPDVTGTARRAPVRGTYAIDGFMLTLRRDDGQVEYHSIVPHPTNPAFIWVDGVWYSRNDSSREFMP